VFSRISGCFILSINFIGDSPVDQRRLKSAELTDVDWLSKSALESFNICNMAYNRAYNIMQLKPLCEKESRVRTS